DVQGVHRNDLVKTMRGVFRENLKSRMTVRDIGALEAFSAKAGPLPKVRKHRGENDDDERSSWTMSQYSAGPKSGGGSNQDAEESVQDWMGPEVGDLRPVQPLLERIGGSQTVVKVVSTVYDWLLPRPEFGRFFLACPLKMGRIRAGISSFLTELLEDSDKADLEMLSNVHWNLGVSDFLFTDFADALLEAFRTWGSRGDSAMAEIQAALEKVRLPITAGHRARLAAAQTDRCPQEIVWLVSSLDCSADDFAHGLSDLLTQDARLEACLNDEKRGENISSETLVKFSRSFWQGTIDTAMEEVFFGESPLFQQDIGAVTLFCENVRQVLSETGMDDNDAKDVQVLMEHSGELVLNRVRNAKLVQAPSCAHDVHWFRKVLMDLCKADPFLQFFADNPKMENCISSIFKLIMNGGAPPAGVNFSSKLRGAHQDLYLTDARYSAFVAHIDKVLRAMFPWPVHPAAVASSNIRSLEGFRTEVLCGSTLRSSRLQAVEGMLNSSADSSKQRVARNARRGRVMAAMQRCATKLFEAIASDNRVSVFFRNTDPACKDRKARYLGCAMGGNLPTVQSSPLVNSAKSLDSTTANSVGSPPSSTASAAVITPASSLKQQHLLFRITDYHFDVFLDHVRRALAGEDPEAADLAPAQLEALRPNVVLQSRTSCPATGAASGARGCPFRRVVDGGAPLLEKVGGTEEIEKILTHMEREAASSPVLVPFLNGHESLPCRTKILELLADAAAGDNLPQFQPDKLQEAHSHLRLLPEHCEMWLGCFNRSMVAHILPPEVARKLQNCFHTLTSALLERMPRMKSDEEDDSNLMHEDKPTLDWGNLQGLIDELEGESGLSKLIESWYQHISEEPLISVFFTGTRPQVMMFQTKFWKKVLREGLHPDGRRQMQMIHIHQHLRITHTHFDCFVRCLLAACEALSLSQGSSNNMRAAVECFRPHIASLESGTGSRSPPRKRRAVERADVGRPPSMSEPYPEPSPGREAEQAEVPESVKELKALLGRYGLDFSRCVEKVDLKELWQCFSRLRRQPLAVLQAEVARFMAAPGDADSCARLLAEVQMQLQNSTSCPVPTPAAPAPQAKVPAASAPARPSVPQVNSREREAQEEVIRILPMRRETFRSATDWAFAVLRATRDPSAVQRSYRSLMRKLHPDKVANTDGVERTITLIREAKDLCEKSFSRVVAPAPPRGLRYEVVESEVGRRRYRLRWLPPEGTASAPVCRYLVAALDPAYGKALTITILEPDYSEELKRFVSVDELTSFVLAEEDLQKMPSLWKQPTATVQVAAANEAGQSSWTKLEIWIAGTRSPASTPSSPSTSTSSESEASSPSQCSHGSFDSEIQRRSGRELQEWLQGQLKVSLMSWLKTLHLPTKGTKQELIERILDVMGVANRELPRRHDH
ncbi:unnamed protein product, partial [Effrenium voratum]